VRAGLLDPARTGSFPDWDYTAGRSASNPVWRSGSWRQSVGQPGSANH